MKTISWVMLLTITLLLGGCTLQSKQGRCIKDCGGSPSCRSRCEKLYGPDEIG